LNSEKSEAKLEFLEDAIPADILHDMGGCKSPKQLLNPMIRAQSGKLQVLDKLLTAFTRVNNQVLQPVHVHV
jgi:hypothetical protein